MITLYTTHCPKCSVLLMKLKNLNIDFKVNDNIDEMTRMGLTSAPMLDVNGTRMDFSEALKWIRHQEED